MVQNDKARALELMMLTDGWKLVKEYLDKNTKVVIQPVEGLDSLIKQAYRNGVTKGHQEVQEFIDRTIESSRKKSSQA